MAKFGQNEKLQFGVNEAKIEETVGIPFLQSNCKSASFC